MAESVDYDEGEARREEAIYELPAMAERRRAVREALALEGDERALSVGCGPGFEPAGFADALGGSGRVLGVDRSPAMLALARERCADRERVGLARGEATALPVADGSVDAAAAVQVYEYVDDVAAGLAALARALAPGGRAVVYDTDWETLVWRSPAPERARRVLAAWNDHCPHPRLGSRLGPLLANAGLRVERVEPTTLLDTALGETFAGRLLPFVAEYAAGHPDVATGTAEAWAGDLRELDEEGGTFFSLTQYLYVVRKPAGAEG